MLVRVAKIGHPGDVHFADSASGRALCDALSFCDTELSAARQGTWKEVSCLRCIELSKEWKMAHRSALEVMQQPHIEAELLTKWRMEVITSVQSFQQAYDAEVIIPIIKATYGVTLTAQDISDIILDLTPES